MEKEPIDHHVRIANEVFNLENWSEDEIRHFIEYRQQDIDLARADIAKAKDILGE